MDYIKKSLEQIRENNPHEEEFLQAVEEVFLSLGPVFEKHPEFEKANILQRMAEPERQIKFRVSWEDDNGNVQVNSGYRVQFNGAIGPYKGGLRFHPSVYIGIIKFLGFEQIFKNALTGLPIGGGKGGSNFNPKGKSENEVRRFCEAFMKELYRHIGPNVDVPAGDIGVGAREIGLLYGEYRRISGSFDAGVLTGKGLTYGGSLVRKEATGFGAIYFVEEMFRYNNIKLEGKTAVISGSGNVALYAAKKATEKGIRVIAMSDSDGYVVDESGIDVDLMINLKEVNRKRISEYAKERPSATYHEGWEGIWDTVCDIALPCATQNDIDIEKAKKIVAAGTKFVIEGANMPTTNEAMRYFLDNGIIVGPAKAVNAGGVSTSALEMAQNSMKYSWTFEEVDAKLKEIMVNIHTHSVEASEEYGYGYNLVAGANIAGFLKVAHAMIAQGIY